MSIVLDRPPSSAKQPETLAELVEHLGGIPLERIRMDPPPGTATEEDVLRLEAQADKQLVRS